MVATVEWTRLEVEQAYFAWSQRWERSTVVGFVPLDTVTLRPQQAGYLQARLSFMHGASGVTAVVLGLLYREQEVQAIPEHWRVTAGERQAWTGYVEAYQKINAQLNAAAHDLAARFGGVAEPATMSGRVNQVRHVDDYFPLCASHRAFAERAGIGWRGRHGLIVTPEVGPALRLATVFLPGRVEAQPRPLAGCGECRACIELCPILRRGGDYREGCRRHIQGLKLGDEVCGLCVRACWEQVTAHSG